MATPRASTTLSAPASRPGKRKRTSVLVDVSSTGGETTAALERFLKRDTLQELGNAVSKLRRVVSQCSAEVDQFTTRALAAKEEATSRLEKTKEALHAAEAQAKERPEISKAAYEELLTALSNAHRAVMEFNSGINAMPNEPSDEDRRYIEKLTEARDKAAQELEAPRKRFDDIIDEEKRIEEDVRASRAMVKLEASKLAEAQALLDQADEAGPLFERYGKLLAMGPLQTSEVMLGFFPTFGITLDSLDIERRGS